MTLSAPPRPLHRLCDPAQAATVFAGLAREAGEVIALAYLDAELGLIGSRHIGSRGRDWAEVPFREVAGDALAFGARALIAAHNHPSGVAAPSRADIMTTRALNTLLRPLGIRLVDHLIVTRREIVSFAALGLL